MSNIKILFFSIHIPPTKKADINAEYSASAVILIEKLKYLHMQNIHPNEAEISAYSKPNSMNQITVIFCC